MSFITWDNAAVALAIIAVLLRLADRPRPATLASSISVLAATVGQASARWRSLRRQDGPIGDAAD